MLDSDLAELYGVTTGRLNEQVSRNRGRFPEDFAFQLTLQEFAALISQSAISSWAVEGVERGHGFLPSKGLPCFPAYCAHQRRFEST
ncbi:MAG: ORF6N domain-containing protein [Planctomycetota bacterium]|nr:ORF6N domain-containing protein [Planctomycetota bacterium]MDA1138084.1 ORF6N domain-containing protein [Planctomycetota bacterium]